MTALKHSFRINLSPVSSWNREGAYLAGFPIVAAMPDLDSRNFDYAPIAPAAIAALAAAGIHTYGDLYRAPQAALDNDEIEPGAASRTSAASARRRSKP